MSFTVAALSIVILMILGGSACAHDATTTDAATRILWKTSIVPVVQSAPIAVDATIDSDYMIVVQGEGTVTGFDGRTGATLWTYAGLNATGLNIQQVTQVPKKSTVIILAVFAIVALDVRTGVPLWMNMNLPDSANSVLATEDVVLISLYASMMAYDTTTGASLYNRTQTSTITQPVSCGVRWACWTQFPSSEVNGEVVILDLQLGTVSHSTSLPITTEGFVKQFLVTDSHFIVCYDRYVDFWRFGFGVAAVDIATGGIAWVQNLPQAADTNWNPAAIGDGTLGMMINLQGPDGPSAVSQILGVDPYSGALLFTRNISTMNPSFIDAPTWLSIGDGRLWVGMVSPLARFVAFDLVTGMVLNVNFTAPTAMVPLAILAPGTASSGPCWIVSNLVGVTVWSALNGAFVSRTTKLSGISNAQTTIGGGRVVLTGTDAVAVIDV